MSKTMMITASANNGKARIEIKGAISGWKETEKNFTSSIEQMIKEGIEDVHLYINSPGGECFEANEIVNVIKRFPGKITGEGGAMVASAATYIAVHCEEFTMPKNGLFMIHQVSGYGGGKVADIEAYLKLMQKLNATYLNAYLAKTTDKKKLQEEWEKGDYWMTAKEAKEMGFITNVGNKIKINKTTAEAIVACGYQGALLVEEEPNNQQPKQEEEGKMNLQLLAGRLGLEATATESQIIAQIDVMKKQAERASALEAQIKARQEKDIEALVNEAIKDKRITADAKDAWKEMLATSFDKTSQLLASMKAPEMPEIQKPAQPTTANTFEGKTFAELQNDAQALERLMKQDEDLYERMLNDFVKSSM